jgi:C1A family cysteine protease
MKKFGLLVSLFIFSSCDLQNNLPETATPLVDSTKDSRSFLYNPITGSVSDLTQIQAQGGALSGCVFEIANAHISGTVPGSVKVNGTGKCAGISEPYYLSVTMVLEKCNNASGSSCYAYKTGPASRKYVASAGATWYNSDINSFAPCSSSAYFRGRLIFSATNPSGVALAVPLVTPVGNVSYVQC